MSANIPPIQDMPPKGGYSKINFARVPAKRLFTGLQMIGGFLVIHGISVWGFLNITKPMMRHEEIEMRSAAIATYPFFRAEKDRRALLMVRKNREVEEELMKDVEGWEVGKYQNEPIFKTVGANEWVPPLDDEYFAHAPPSDANHNSRIYYRR